jgi:hypothetical protein
MTIVEHWPRNRVLALIFALVVAGWLLIALTTTFKGSPSIVQMSLVGAVLGTMFGHVSLAGAWCALGPFSLVQRLPLACAWVAALAIAFGWMIQGSGPSDGKLVIWLAYAGLLAGQWLLVQGCLCLPAAVMGLSIRHANDLGTVPGTRYRQFGIRELMYLTVIVATVLGAGRLMLGGMAKDQNARSFSGGIGALLAVGIAHAVIALPLIGASLLRTRVVPGLLAALLLVALATWFEVGLLQWIEGRSIPASEFMIVGVVSSLQALWVLVIVFLLRMAGYELTSRSRTQNPLAS